MIGIDLFWYETESDGALCVGCDSLIEGKVYILVFFLGGDEFTETETRLCEKCYMAKFVEKE